MRTALGVAFAVFGVLLLWLGGAVRGTAARRWAEMFPAYDFPDKLWTTIAIAVAALCLAVAVLGFIGVINLD